MDDIVSFKIAKALRDVGFSGSTNYAYKNEDDAEPIESNAIVDLDKLVEAKKYFKAPTKEEALSFLIYHIKKMKSEMDDMFLC